MIWICVGNLFKAYFDEKKMDGCDIKRDIALPVGTFLVFEQNRNNESLLHVRSYVMHIVGGVHSTVVA